MDLSGWKAALLKRLPERQQVMAVFGVIALLVYGWTIYWYLWKLPSWLYFMTVSEMLVTFAYELVVNFLESLLILLIPILLSLILPLRWFRDRFLSRASILVILLLVALMRYLQIITRLQDFPPNFLRLTLLVAGGIAVLVFLVGRVAFLRRVVEEVAGRAVIFLYIFVPLTALSFLVVLFRNIFV